MITRLQRIKLKLGIGYLVMAETDLDSEFEHYASSYADALGWLSCYPLADMVSVYRLSYWRMPKLVAERSEWWDTSGCRFELVS